MKTKILFILVVTQHFTVSEEVKLPAESQLLLTKMGQFETETRKKAEEAIEDKRKQVAGILTQQMHSEAKAGRIEVAIKIRESIQKLTPTIVVEEVKLAEAALPTNEAELTAFLKDSKWRWSDDRFITFQSDGSTLKSWGNYKPKWVVISPKQVRFLCTWEDDGEVFTFNSKFDSFTADSKRLDGSPSNFFSKGKAVRVRD